MTKRGCYVPLISYWKLMIRINLKPIIMTVSEEKMAYFRSSLLAIFFFPALGGFLFGYELGATQYVLTQLQTTDYAAIKWSEHIRNSSLIRGLFTASATGGAFLASFIIYAFQHTIGRRKELLVASVLYITGSLLEWISSVLQGSIGLVIMLVGRWIYGVGIVLSMHAAPAYLAEMSPPPYRGLFVASKEAMIVLGILVGQIIGFCFREMERGWKWTYGMELPLALIMLIGNFYLPRSARWCVLNNLKAEAERSLQFFMKDAKEVETALSEILQNVSEIESSSSSSSSFSLGWIIRKYKMQLVVGLGCITLQQISGQPSVLYYTNEIFHSFGLSDSSTLLVGLFKLLSTLLAVFTVDRYGRRKLLLLGLGFMLVALLLLTIAFRFPSNDLVNAIILCAFFTYIAGYQLGFGPISWILVSEIFPLAVRGQSVALAVLANFGWNLVVTLVFDQVRESIGTSAVFGLFLGVGILGLAFVYSYVPETKGLSLEKIETVFSAGTRSYDERLLVVDAAQEDKETDGQSSCDNDNAAVFVLTQPLLATSDS